MTGLAPAQEVKAARVLVDGVVTTVMTGQAPAQETTNLERAAPVDGETQEGRGARVQVGEMMEAAGEMHLLEDGVSLSEVRVLCDDFDYYALHFSLKVYFLYYPVIGAEN